MDKNSSEKNKLRNTNFFDTVFNWRFDWLAEASISARQEKLTFDMTKSVYVDLEKSANVFHILIILFFVSAIKVFLQQNNGKCEHAIERAGVNFTNNKRTRL